MQRESRPDSRYATFVGAHTGEHVLHMRDWSVRENAVAEIENEGATCKGRKHVIDSPVQRGAAGKQRERIKITLNRQMILQLRTYKLAIDSPIDTDRAG